MNKQFEEWLELKAETPYMISTFLEDLEINILAPDYFTQLPFSMQWGVYLLFFDTVGIRIELFYSRVVGTWTPIINETTYPDRLTRTEAQKEAIKKALEILNKQK